ncbi:hypothetical protein DUZ99_09270 [Xylanibacillus composti]|uniref:hypothetical protein n=1 Tax=Xylanibacillus composti TaxID=1572762 RepID=UPI001BCE1F61|nr:hypothetical protein [Xylanibacillus composti]MDT9725175.1 hypothetical protein [Xylanibacillus composti]
MNPKQLTDQSSIYQYTLLKRIRISSLMKASYILLLTGCLMFLFTREPFGSCVLVLAVVRALQFVFKRTALHWMHPTLASRWSVSFRFPFVGLVPQQPVLYASYRNIEIHAFLAGVFLIGSVFIWFPLDAVASICCTFIILHLPTLMTLCYRSKPQEGSSTWIKLQHSDVSYYRA